MTILRKPSIMAQSISEHSAQLSLKVPETLEDFKGHFPQFPLLPGVTQIDWAVYYAVSLLATPNQFEGMEVIKFQEPILPNMQVELNLDWQSDKQKLYFSYTSVDESGEQHTHSSGRVALS